MSAPTKLKPMPPPQSENPLPVECTAPLTIAVAPNSGVVAGVITPLAVRSLNTNQLPGGSTPWILSEAPSESSRPVGLTAAGVFEPLAPGGNDAAAVVAPPLALLAALS